MKVLPRPQVMIIEDQSNWRELLSELLANEYDVTCASNYTEALTELFIENKFFHAIIVDIRLRDEDDTNEDGLRLIEVIKKTNQCTNTIVLTGYPTPRTIKKAFKNFSAFEYVEKYPENGTGFNHICFLDKIRKAVEDAEKRRKSFVFVLMPFSPDYQDIYQDVIKKVVKNIGLICLRADDFFRPHRIMDDVQRGIRKAKLLIADLSGKNPNVFYEVGMGHSINKTVLLITRNIHDVPPKLRDMRCILYRDSLDGADHLEDALTLSIQNLQKSDYYVEPIFKGRGYGVESNLCFVLAPSTEPGKRAYKQIVKKVAEEAHFNCVSAQSVFSTENIMNEIWSQLNKASVIIADLSGRDPDVFYLLGISHGLNKKVILLARSKEDIPFDLRGRSHLLFSDDTYRQGKEARERLRQAMQRNLR